MKIRCVWEHNGNDSLLYSDNFVGAYTRGESKEIAVAKMKREVESYLKWKGDGKDKWKEEKDEEICEVTGSPLEVELVQEKSSELNIRDADSDVLFEKEKEELSFEEYVYLRDLALKSAADFLALYEAIPDKHESCLTARKTFYGTIPRTAYEMYEHTKNVNDYYFAELDVEADNFGTILECRKRGFEHLEHQPDFLKNAVHMGSYGEEWTLRKLLRRFIWHDRIHARAMYRMAMKTFGWGSVPDVFRFDCESGDVKLMKPSMKYADDIMQFRRELIEAKDRDCFAGCGSLKECTTAEEWLKRLADMFNVDTCPKGSVTSDTYIAVRVSDDRIVGIIDLRHHINHPILSVWGGHMGYSVRPSERGKGYAKEMLRQNLENCKARKMDKVMITCDRDNAASERTIVANGGIFEKEVCVDEEWIKRYWITL